MNRKCGEKPEFQLSPLLTMIIATASQKGEVGKRGIASYQPFFRGLLIAS
jgi:hypothetical protein